MAEGTLRPYQIEDLTHYIANPRSLNLSDPGCGKTASVCVYLYYQWSDRGHKSLWSMPKSLLEKNRDELLRFTDFKPADVAILEEDMITLTENQAKQLKAHMETGKYKIAKRLYAYRKHWPTLIRDRKLDLIAICEAKVILVGFRFMARFWKRLMQSHPNIGCLAVDEMHMAYGSVDSQNTKSLFGVMRYAECFIGMTGTLLNGRLDSVYPAIHVIEPRYYISYEGFLQQHVAFQDDYGRVLSWKNEAKVGEILIRHGIRRTFQEVYGEEDVVFLPDLVYMGPKMREQYELFHEQAMLELLDGRIIDGALPGVATIRARQICAHPETMALCEGEETGKDERLRIHITDAIARGESTLIFSVHIAEQERIKRLLESMGRRVGLMNGATSTAQRGWLDKAFKAREIDDIVGSPKTMAVGWNWEHVDHVMAVSYEYQDVDWLQAYRRASRGTRTKTLRVSIMQYQDSVDGRVLQIIREKSILANKVDPSRPILQLAA